jgi:hypothetical protein
MTMSIDEYNAIIDKLLQEKALFPDPRKANCFQCLHRGDLSFSAHSCCKAFDNVLIDRVLLRPPIEVIITTKVSVPGHKKYELPFVMGNPRGITNGWFIWPVNFDPTWLVGCFGFRVKT